MSPRSKPAAFLTAEWRHLVMLNYAVDPPVVQPYVPAGTELDFFQGRTYVSVVGFLFLKTRLLGMPIPFHRRFEEINLRFYVRRRNSSEMRRGVVFIKEIVPRFMVSLIARRVYNENYVTRKTRSHIDIPHGVRYEWLHDKKWWHVSADIQGEPRPLIAGQEPEFITEHYWGYTRQRDGGTMEYQVEHPPWRVWTATSAHFDCDVASLYGPQFVPYLRVPPTSAFVAEGSPVVVRRGVRLA